MTSAVYVSQEVPAIAAIDDVGLLVLAGKVAVDHRGCAGGIACQSDSIDLRRLTWRRSRWESAIKLNCGIRK